MIARQFIAKWGDSTLRERQGSQEHFIDLCRLLGEPTPAEDDPHGDRYCFERGAEKVGGGDGWADVWRKGCFGWEYKGRHRNLDAALRQLLHADLRGSLRSPILCSSMQLAVEMKAVHVKIGPIFESSHVPCISGFWRCSCLNERDGRCRQAPDLSTARAV